jgi:hypothetical protein
MDQSRRSFRQVGSANDVREEATPDRIHVANLPSFGPFSTRVSPKTSYLATSLPSFHSQLPEVPRVKQIRQESGLLLGRPLAFRSPTTDLGYLWMAARHSIVIVALQVVPFLSAGGAVTSKPRREKEHARRPFRAD